MSSDSIDLKIFEAINNFAGQYAWLDQLGIFVASSVGFVLLAILAYYFLFKKSYRMTMVAMTSALIARYGVVAFIRFLYQRPRPISVDGVHQLVTNEKWSFPSGHTSFFFALSTAVYFYNKKLGLLFYMVSFLMGISRIFVGVHWPTDIMGGILVGCICAEIVQLCAKKFFPVRKEDAPTTKA